MFSKGLRTLLLGSALLAAPFAASAQTVAEVGDAGETLATAQVINGPVTRITGALDNLGSIIHPIGDIDLYRIYISDTAAFGVTVETDLDIVDHPEIEGVDDTMLFLFDAQGVQVGFNDDVLGLPGVYPIFNPGEFATLAPGFYYLGFDLFPTHSILENGGILAGFDRSDVDNFISEGAYALNITGAQGGGQALPDLPIDRNGVPEPATWAMMILGFGAAGSALRRRRSLAVA